MAFMEKEKQLLDGLILTALERYSGKWLVVGEVAGEVRTAARELGIGGSRGPSDIEIGYRLRSLRKRGEVRNRPTENPYAAGNYEWRLA